MELNQIQLDALREISSIAGGNAATSLSVMLGRRVEITVPDITIEAVEKVPQALANEEDVANVVYFTLEGPISGTILLILSVFESLRLVDVLTEQNVTEMENLDEMGLSALKELGNITIGTYIRAMEHVLKIRINYSIPGFASDMLGAILDGTLARLSLETGEAILIENRLLVEGVTLAEGIAFRTYIVFIPEDKSLKALLDALQV